MDTMVGEQTKMTISGSPIWIGFEYRDFYDVPRMILFWYRESLFLLDCPFEDECDDYSDGYDVYLMPDVRSQGLADSWERLPDKAKQHLARVPVVNITFDHTRRKKIDVRFMEETGRIHGLWD